MKTPHPLSEILFAVANGYAVQMCMKPCLGNWFDWESGNTNPLDSDADEYLWRIKPEPKPDIVKYAVLAADQSGFTLSGTQFNPDNLKITFSGETGKLIKAEIL